MNHLTRQLSLINSSDGLTKREYFASIALQALLLKTTDEKEATYKSVQIADELISALNKDIKKKLEKLNNEMR